LHTDVIESLRHHVDSGAKLFNHYCIFYELPDDLDKSRDYHRVNVQQERSRIFLEVNDDKEAWAFAELYSTTCSSVKSQGRVAEQNRPTTTAGAMSVARKLSRTLVPVR